MIKINCRNFVLGLVIFQTPLLFSQNLEKEETYHSFDKIVALENTGLANGAEYIEQHIIKNDQHKYFLSSKFVSGNVHYDGQPYVDIPIKFNIYDDLLVVLMDNAGGESSFQLHKKKIKSFSLKGHDFIQVSEAENFEDGFFEVLLDLSGTLLLKKHRKKIEKHLDRNFTYYEFENDAAEYVVFFNGLYYPVDSRRDFQKIFPGQEKEIKTFYRKNSSLRKSNPDLFLMRLLQNINPIPKNPL